jgi:hypothetical protein
MREEINAHINLEGKPEGNRPLARRRYRWVDNIKIILKEIKREIVDWIHLA